MISQLVLLYQAFTDMYLHIYVLKALKNYFDFDIILTYRDANIDMYIIF